MPPLHSQPSTVSLSPKSILSLPFRLCNPPPAIGKVRSFGLTPLFDVRLDDVLDRKHLPPLGLKDFEEWLLYVEMCPENLYFILWLREYRKLYGEWQRQRNSPKDPVGASNAASRLAMFYSRAKQTFFTPNTQYELNLCSNVLVPFTKPDQDPHPDPTIFDPAEAETRRMLDQSLRRLIHAQMTNVGNTRAICGIVAGIFFIVVGFLPPIVTNFVGHESRWLRLTAIPGMWLGLTILLSALHGVCLGVYIFGDLRQLRKFELSRPPIPKPARSSESRSRGTPPQPVMLPPAPPSPAHTHSRRSRRHRDGLPDRPEYYDVAGSRSAPTSPVYIETNPIEGPATCPMLAEYCSPQNDAEWLRQQQQRERERQLELEKEPTSPNSFTSTATFIGPFLSPSTTDMSGYWDSDQMLSLNAHWYRARAMEDLERLSIEAVRRQPLTEFDFDGLPHPQVKPVQHPEETTRRSWEVSSAARVQREWEGQGAPLASPRPGSDGEENGRWQWFLDFVDRIQTRCSIKKWGPTPGNPDSRPVFLGGTPPYLSSKKSKSRATSKSNLSISTCPMPEEDTATTQRVKERSKLIRAVPPFAVPLTRVLNPVIVRGQWEIVVRSAGLAFLITWVVCGSLLAIPPH